MWAAPSSRSIDTSTLGYEIVSPSIDRSSGASTMPAPSRRTIRSGGAGGGPFGDELGERAARRDGVDELPLDRLAALHSLGACGEDVGEVAPHVALVDDACQATRAGQHRQQRYLRQRDGARPVVDEHDLVARQRQLVAAAGGRSVDRRDPHLSRMGGGVFDRVAGLVGELAEVDLVGVRRSRQHLDVGSRAEHLVEAARDDHGSHLRVLEAQALHRVVELDVDAEVVRVELELVVAAQPTGRVDLHRERGDRSVDAEPPVAVHVGAGPEVDQF